MNCSEAIQVQINHQNIDSPLMDKIAMNDNQSASFNFNWDKIFLIINWGRPIKGHPIFTSNEASHKTICKQQKVKEIHIKKIAVNDIFFIKTKLEQRMKYFCASQE